MVIPSFAAAIPEEIEVNYKDSFSMIYYLDQTFNANNTSTNPNYYTKARTLIYYDISFESGEWRSSILYIAKFRLDPSEEIKRINFDFDYLFHNTSREIFNVIHSYFNNDEDFLNKHPIFYSGTNPGSLEPFLLDELMLIGGDVGIIEKAMSYNGIKKVIIEGKQFEVFEFIINTTITEKLC